MAVEAKSVGGNKGKLIFKQQIIDWFAASLFSSGFSVFVRSKPSSKRANRRHRKLGEAFSLQDFRPKRKKWGAFFSLTACLWTFDSALLFCTSGNELLCNESKVSLRLYGTTACRALFILHCPPCALPHREREVLTFGEIISGAGGWVWISSQCLPMSHQQDLEHLCLAENRSWGRVTSWHRVTCSQGGLQSQLVQFKVWRYNSCCYPEIRHNETVPVTGEGYFCRSNYFMLVGFQMDSN